MKEHQKYIPRETNLSAVARGAGINRHTVVRRFMKQLIYCGFSAHKRTEDGTLCWAECAGSGKSPYRVSIDWTNPDAPVCRCSCPSRQFPCKHALGLMFERLSGKSFDEAEIPEDIAEKRAKQAARAAKCASTIPATAQPLICTSSLEIFTR